MVAANDFANKLPLSLWHRVCYDIYCDLSVCFSQLLAGQCIPSIIELEGFMTKAKAVDDCEGADMFN